mgnify:FL=1
MKEIQIFCFCLVLIFSSQIKAQEHQDNVWKAFFSDYSLTTSKTIRLEKHIRTKRFFSENDQYLLRPSLILKLNQNSSFAAGITFLSTNLSDDRLTEYNIWQQFGFSLPIKKTNYFGWIRLEQRWMKRGKMSNNYGSRIRFRTGFKFPLKFDAIKFSTRFVVFNEVFLLVEKNFPYRYNQNWTFFGFEQKISSKINLLTGFQRNSIIRENDFLHKNIWSTVLFYKI